MKKNLFLKFIQRGAIISLLIVPFSFISCDDDDKDNSYNNYYTNLVTVNTVNPVSKDTFLLGGDVPFYFTTDKANTLWPAQFSYYLNGYYYLQAQGRALIGYNLLGDNKNGYKYSIRLDDIRRVLTKPIAKLTTETPQNSPLRGNNRASIEDVWIGDKYINITFLYGSSYGAVHFINLVLDETAAGANPENGILNLKFVHDAAGDGGSIAFRGIACFPIPDWITANTTIRIAYIDANNETKYKEVKYDELYTNRPMETLSQKMNSISSSALYN